MIPKSLINHPMQGVSPLFCEVVFNASLAQAYTYICEQVLPLYARVEVTFGHQRQVGLVVAMHDTLPDGVVLEDLKPVLSVWDGDSQCGLWLSSHGQFLSWAADYYQAPLGQALWQAVPKCLRKQAQPKSLQVPWLVITDAGRVLPADVWPFQRSTKQVALWQWLMASGDEAWPWLLLKKRGFDRVAANRLVERGFLRWDIRQLLHIEQTDDWVMQPRLHELNVAQQAVVDEALNQSQNLSVFQPFALSGVTGSGKTEVYLHLACTAIEQGKQVLWLVPEIGLTPQMTQRIAQGLGLTVGQNMVVSHSDLAAGERCVAWAKARNGEGCLVLGTRSSVLLPMAQLGLVIVDEEHDGSYKEHAGMLYHARDLAIRRGQLQACPVLLGSATLSLETLANVRLGRYIDLVLDHRFGEVALPQWQVVDTQGVRLNAGLHHRTLEAMKQVLAEGHQVLVFLNRRGFSSALLCQECGWVAHCEACHKPYTFHQYQGKLKCHHCGWQASVPTGCPCCHGTHWHHSGLGTEQLSQRLQQWLPDFSVLQMDRDTVASSKAWREKLQRIQNRQVDVIVGTQLLAKGHHFPAVEMVVIVDVDSAWYATDFRATEQLCQLLAQVSGRAGRVSGLGQVWLQTQWPNHPLLQQVMANQWADVWQSLLMERQQLQLPPYASMALIRAQSPKADKAQQWLQTLRDDLVADLNMPSEQVSTWLTPVVEASMPKKAGQFRWQFWIQCPQRRVRQRILSMLNPLIKKRSKSGVRVKVDVDPFVFS